MAIEFLPASRISILLVSSRAEDHESLDSVFQGSQFQLDGVHTVAGALRRVRRAPYDVPVVISEQTLPDGDWKLLLTEIEDVAVRPRLIVSSRLADYRLWAEVLDMGAFDLIVSAPFVRDEVLWVTQSAWLEWNSESRPSAVARIGPRLSRSHTDRAASALAACGHI